jgi:hypothetical protein
MAAKSGKGFMFINFIYMYLAFFAILNSFSVMGWLSVLIGGRENPDTLYNIFGEKPPTFHK